MTDLDPEIWNNKTLGRAANNERLDRLEKQQHEDRNAKLENREPREVVVDNDYPGWRQEVSESTGTVPSTAPVVHFADERDDEKPDTGPRDPEEESSIPVNSDPEEDSSDEPNEEESEEIEGNEANHKWS